MASYNITNDNKARIVAALDKAPRIPYWELAEEMDLHENTVSKRLRRPNDEQTAEFMAAIERIREKQAQE